MISWIFAAILTGPIIYILLTLFSRAPSTSAEYEYGDRKANPSDILDSSIMYALQVAVVVLFAAWGHQYGFSSAIVPAFWMLGYVLFSLLLKDSFLLNFSADLKFRTLHDFLGGYGKSKSVCAVSAFLTLIGLAGPAMFEAFTVGRTVISAAPSLGEAGSAGLAIAFIATALIYMIWGGFVGVVRLEQFQLALGYGGFNVVFALLMFLNADKIGHYPTLTLSSVCLVSVIIFFVCKQWCEQFLCCYAPEITKLFISSSNFFISSVDF